MWTLLVQVKREVAKKTKRSLPLQQSDQSQRRTIHQVRLVPKPKRKINPPNLRIRGEINLNRVINPKRGMTGRKSSIRLPKQIQTTGVVKVRTKIKVAKVGTLPNQIQTTGEAVKVVDTKIKVGTRANKTARIPHGTNHPIINKIVARLALGLRRRRTRVAPNLPKAVRMRATLQEIYVGGTAVVEEATPAVGHPLAILVTHVEVILATTVAVTEGMIDPETRAVDTTTDVGHQLGEGKLDKFLDIQTIFLL
mmetsp:Transcript_11861/g.21789  ORF Transcript_11861/g.21789 Transcript_11861/m.21789 type:complete len:252 (+) Transcript_11861:4154-4909(+)